MNNLVTGSRTGIKFNSDGTARAYAGNTIICHVPRPSGIDEKLAEIRHILRRADGGNYAFLPASSWHMTVFEVMNFADRHPDRWPCGFNLEADGRACDAEVARRLGQAAPWWPTDFHMSATGIEARCGGGLTIGLEPFDAAANGEIRSLRDRIAQAVGIRRPDHDRYCFHITLAYCIRPHDPKAWTLYRPVIEQASRAAQASFADFRLGPAEFCTFENMLAFDRRFYLD